MSIHWEGEEEDRRAAQAAAAEREEFVANAVGEHIVVANEFTEIRVMRVETRNGSRLLIESPKSGQWITLCPLELEALTWQSPATFSAMIGHPLEPLFADDEEA